MLHLVVLLPLVIQTFAGAKTFNTLLTGSAGLTVTGAAINLNDSSNFAVNIGTGSSTGTVTLGGTGTQTIAVGNGQVSRLLVLVLLRLHLLLLLMVVLVILRSTLLIRLNSALLKQLVVLPQKPSHSKLQQI